MQSYLVILLANIMAPIIACVEGNFTVRLSASNMTQGVQGDIEDMEEFKMSTSQFYAMHFLASFLPLSVSLVPCVWILYRILYSEGDFYELVLGERLTVYLTTCDFCYIVQDMVQVLYLLVTAEPLPTVICSLVGSGTFLFLLAQMLLVFFISVNSYLMVVRGTKVNIGRRDWVLLAISFGLPSLLTIVLNCRELIGPGPHAIWCMFNIEQWKGTVVQFVAGLGSMLILLATAVLYSLVWWKLHKVARRTSVTSIRKYDRIAKVLLVYVLVYLLQWLPAIIYVWMFMLGADVPFFFYYILVISINIGGFLNFVAYTWVRKRSQAALMPTTGAVGPMPQLALSEAPDRGSPD